MDCGFVKDDVGMLEPAVSMCSFSEGGTKLVNACTVLYDINDDVVAVVYPQQ